MSDNNSSAHGGLGCFTTLTLIFVVLKLIGLIHWPWFWVLSPLIAAAGIWVAVFGVIALIGLIGVVADRRK